jgi:predicted nucleotidyltransferase
MRHHDQLPPRNTTVLAIALAVSALCLSARLVLPGGVRAWLQAPPIVANGRSVPSQADALAPFRLITHEPERNDVGIALSALISATFDGELDRGTVTNDTFVVHGHLGGLASGAFHHGPGAGTLRLDPDRAFHAGEVLRLSATSGIWSAGGHTLMPYGWQFTAGEVYSRHVAGFTDIGAGLPSVRHSSSAWGDVDNDGDLDILLAGYSASGEIANVYRNDGAGTFTDIGAGLPGLSFGSVAWGDYDNDGDLDILLTGLSSAYGQIARVYRNDGDGAFSDIGAGLTGMSSSSAAWGDYDNDGDLDILLAGAHGYVSFRVRLCKVYRNDGGGSGFSDIGARLEGADRGSVAWGDYDNDGRLDILLTGSSAFGDIGRVYRNMGDDTFANIYANLAKVGDSSVAWGDYDNDGDLDILLTGWRGSGPLSKVYCNEGGGVFADIGAGLTGVYDGSVAWGDYDNDGDLDILLSGRDGTFVKRSKIYRNDGTFGFTDIGAALPGACLGSVAWGDVDNDGDLDILLAGDVTYPDSVCKVYRNNSQPNLGAVTPPSGSGPPGVTTTFTTTWSDPDGWQDLKQCYFHVGDSPSVVGNVTLLCHAQQDKLWLRSDDGTAWTGGCAPGSASILENSQAIVHCDLTTVQGSGDTVSVTWAVQFKPGYSGTKKLGLKCKDVDKATANGEWKGTWTIE